MKAASMNIDQENALEQFARRVGNILILAFHYIALFVIGSAIVWSASVAFIGMVEERVVNVQDILLLFIYLELGAMVGIYFRTNRLPVRFLIYIAVTVLTRMLIESVQADHELRMEIIYVPLAILVLAIATWIIRYTSFNYPSKQDDSMNHD